MTVVGWILIGLVALFFLCMLSDACVDRSRHPWERDSEK